METTFFQELAAIVLQDKQSIRITVTKVGEDLTALVVHEGKHINMSGTAAEFDAEFLNQIKSIPNQEKKFTAEVSDAPETEEEEEGSDDDKTASKKADAKKADKKAANKKEEKKAGAKPEVEKIETEKKEGSHAPSVDAETENKKTVFKHSMATGKKLFDERKYKDAENAFKEALDLFPDDATAKTEYEKAVKWVKAVESL
jgi:TolA-binding protein